MWTNESSKNHNIELSRLQFIVIPKTLENVKKEILNLIRTFFIYHDFYLKFWISLSHYPDVNHLEYKTTHNSPFLSLFPNHFCNSRVPLTHVRVWHRILLVVVSGVWRPLLSDGISLCRSLMCESKSDFVISVMVSIPLLDSQVPTYLLKIWNHDKAEILPSGR